MSKEDNQISPSKEHKSENDGKKETLEIVPHTNDAGPSDDIGTLGEEGRPPAMDQQPSQPSPDKVTMAEETGKLRNSSNSTLADCSRVLSAIVANLADLAVQDPNASTVGIPLLEDKDEAHEPGTPFPDNRLMETKTRADRSVNQHPTSWNQAAAENFPTEQTLPVDSDEEEMDPHESSTHRRKLEARSSSDQEDGQSRLKRSKRYPDLQNCLREHKSE